jgi:hypothetical protein
MKIFELCAFALFQSIMLSFVIRPMQDLQVYRAFLPVVLNWRALRNYEAFKW